MTPRGLAELAQRTYRSVSGQVDSLFELWSVYDLWKRDFDAARTLNAVAPALFGTLHRSAFQGVLILIRQLDDPPFSRVRKENRRNSSLRGLLSLAFGDDLENVPIDLSLQIDLYHQLASPICELADKAVAHTDLAWGLDDDQFSGIPYFRLDDCVREARKFLVLFEDHFGLPQANAEHSQLRAEAITLVERLRGHPP